MSWIDDFEKRCCPQCKSSGLRCPEHGVSSSSFLQDFVEFQQTSVGKKLGSIMPLLQAGDIDWQQAVLMMSDAVEEIFEEEEEPEIDVVAIRAALARMPDLDVVAMGPELAAQWEVTKAALEGVRVALDEYESSDDTT